MHECLYKSLEKHEILHSLQFGFRTSHSINHALVSLTEAIKNSLDNRKFGCGMFIDLQKAFDAVNHHVLLMKLEHYGIIDQFQSIVSRELKQGKMWLEVNKLLLNYYKTNFIILNLLNILHLKLPASKLEIAWDTWSFRRMELPLNCHYSQVHFHPEW